MMWEIGLFGAFLSVTVPLARWFYQQRQRGELVRRLQATLQVLHAKSPASISPPVWEATTVWTLNIGEDLFCNDKIPASSRARLIEALQQRLEGPFGPELIPWIWDEYTAIARDTSSERFVRNHRCIAVIPVLRDALSIRAPGIAPDKWDSAVRETATALDAIHAHHSGGNAPPIAEEDRFLGSVTAILTRPVRPGRLLTVWDQLSEAGPVGKEYARSRLAKIRRDLATSTRERQ